MGKITSLFVRKVLGVASGDFDPRAVLRGVGIDPDAPPDPKLMVADTDYYAFLRQLVRDDTAGTTLPLRAGAAMRCDDYGAFGLAWKSATNLRESFGRAERYARVLTSVSTYQLESTEGGALMRLNRAGERHLGMRLSNEATLASIVSISREVASAPFNPRAVFFQHAAPATVADHEIYFGCPVHFGAEYDALLVSAASLSTPNVLGDAGISRFFESHLAVEVSQLADEETWDRRVRDQIARALSGGIPVINHVAQRLGMSGRTLQRRLRQSGHSYNALVDESRRQLAERLLAQTDYSLAEVAFMTGFSEQSAFSRAFKRWAGQTPRSYRIRFTD
ncbi:AraC family transcriptional regulator [Synoicihabitans lomoniglobus]|uniref:AraC family transcriptional regulator n=1 Tax=Synoicihabitans lomoniglobus TaxID=2909285 RepID=A0AAE9ZXQ8_9BACT|nr:AraC family transcriptional regulator [Opitutaceae bacterium LMO-M01]WED63133.1 AraC family transcriptional regulator [Opitutaceae bacterium LMO-M01]